MADQGIKKVVIPRSSLPAVTQNNQHIVRFRIVSEDRNRTSEWSQKFFMSGSTISDIDSEHSVSGKVVSLVWDDPNRRAAYDIFAKFDNADFVYITTTSSTSHSFINQATTTFRYAIQVQAIGKVYSPDLVLYESEDIPS
jgi:hypothetical protein